MNVLTISVVAFLVHAIWAFVNTLSISEGLLVSKFKQIGLLILNWLLPIIGPISVSIILAGLVPPRRITNRFGSAGAGSTAGNDSNSGSGCSDGSGCGGGA